MDLRFASIGCHGTLRSADDESGTMVTMFRRILVPCSFALAVFGFVFTPAVVHSQDDSNKWTRKYKTPPPSSRIEITILKGDNGKPVENAAVIFHPVEGDRDKGSLELKTNEDGKAIIDVIPIGDTVRLQVIAHGFQTYGQDFKVDKEEMSMEVHLKRPRSQYSIYKDGNGSAKSADQTAPQSTEAAPPAQNDKGSADPKPDQSQPQGK